MIQCFHSTSLAAFSTQPQLISLQLFQKNKLSLTLKGSPSAEGEVLRHELGMTEWTFNGSVFHRTLGNPFHPFKYVLLLFGKL